MVQANPEEYMETLGAEISVLFSENPLFELKASLDFLRMYLTERAVLSVSIRRSLLPESIDNRSLAVNFHTSSFTVSSHTFLYPSYSILFCNSTEN